MFKPISHHPRECFVQNCCPMCSRPEQLTRSCGEDIRQHLQHSVIPWYHHGILGARAKPAVGAVTRSLTTNLSAAVFKFSISYGPNGDDIRLRLINSNPALASFAPTAELAASPGWLPRLPTIFLNFTFKAEYAYDYGMPQWLATYGSCLFRLAFRAGRFLAGTSCCIFVRTAINWLNMSNK